MFVLVQLHRAVLEMAPGPCCGFESPLALSKDTRGEEPPGREAYKEQRAPCEDLLPLPAPPHSAVQRPGRLPSAGAQQASAPVVPEPLSSLLVPTSSCAQLSRASQIICSDQLSQTPPAVLGGVSHKTTLPQDTQAQVLRWLLSISVPPLPNPCLTRMSLVPWTAYEAHYTPRVTKHTSAAVRQGLSPEDGLTFVSGKTGAFWHLVPRAPSIGSSPSQFKACTEPQTTAAHSHLVMATPKEGQTF